MKTKEEINIQYEPLPDNFKRSEWFGVSVCKSCEESLSNYEKMDNGGICPHCGKDSNSTIVDYKNIVIRTVKRYDYAWWPFSQHSYNEGLRESDNKWINRHDTNTQEPVKANNAMCDKFGCALDHCKNDDVYASVTKHRIK